MEEITSNHSGTQLANNTTSVEKLMLDMLGPRQKDFASAVLLTIVYSVIFITGSIGNICTCLVIVRNNCMQTTTNYYLFSLAVSDLLLIFFGIVMTHFIDASLVLFIHSCDLSSAASLSMQAVKAKFWTMGLPTELYSIWEAYPWRLGEGFCYLRQTMMEATSYASVLTITSFTVERYLAICHPLLAHKIAALSRAVKIIISIWIISILVALPYTIHTRTYHAVTIPGTNTSVPNSLICSIPFSDLGGFMYYMFQVSTFLFFVGPVTIIVILYILIGIALRRSPLARGSSDERNYVTMKSPPSVPQQPRRVVIRMLVAVTVAFVVCWAPFHAQRLMTLYVMNWTPDLLLVQSHIFYTSGVLYFVSSTMNPILYNLISKRYRAAFKQTICPCCHTRPTSGSISTARHSERFSKSPGMVVLKNGSDSLKVIFRQEQTGPTGLVKGYETIPLNGARRSTVLRDDAVALSDQAEDSSGRANGSVHFPDTPPLNSSSTLGSANSLNHSSHKSFRWKQIPLDSQNYICKGRDTDRDCNIMSCEKQTADIQTMSDIPPQSLSQHVNGYVSTGTSTVCDYGSSKRSIVR